jgi:predicted glycosyltransferase
VKFEGRVIDRLNTYFHLLLIHGDPKLIELGETFSRMDDINIPIAYTGYICQPPLPGDRRRIRSMLNLAEDEQLIVVSAGSGSVGLPLLKAAVHAFPLLETKNYRLQVFTGPYTSDHDFKRLAAAGSSRIHLERFSDNFPAWLAAADLSISMGGYNTTMNLVAAGCRALVYPFAQNHEQRLRAVRLAKKRCLQLLAETDLVPAVLAERISAALAASPGPPNLMLDGAARTARQLTTLARAEAVS